MSKNAEFNEQTQQKPVTVLQPGLCGKSAKALYAVLRRLYPKYPAATAALTPKITNVQAKGSFAWRE